MHSTCGQTGCEQRPVVVPPGRLISLAPRLADARSAGAGASARGVSVWCGARPRARALSIPTPICGGRRFPLRHARLRVVPVRLPTWEVVKTGGVVLRGTRACVQLPCAQVAVVVVCILVPPSEARGRRPPWGQARQPEHRRRPSSAATRRRLPIRARRAASSKLPIRKGKTKPAVARGRCGEATTLQRAAPPSAFISCQTAPAAGAGALALAGAGVGGSTGTAGAAGKAGAAGAAGVAGAGTVGMGGTGGAAGC